MLLKKLFESPSWGWTVRSPFEDFIRMQRQMDRLLENLSSAAPSGLISRAGVFPLLNLTEDANTYYIRAELPGIKGDDLDIQVTGKSLSISGERKIAEENKNVQYHRREREAGKFSRIINLPGDVASDKVEAQLSNGILTVAIAKAEQAKPRQITVK